MIWLQTSNVPNAFTLFLHPLATLAHVCDNMWHLHFHLSDWKQRIFTNFDKDKPQPNGFLIRKSFSPHIKPAAWSHGSSVVQLSRLKLGTSYSIKDLWTSSVWMVSTICIKQTPPVTKLCQLFSLRNDFEYFPILSLRIQILYSVFCSVFLQRLMIQLVLSKSFRGLHVLRIPSKVCKFSCAGIHPCACE